MLKTEFDNISSPKRGVFVENTSSEYERYIREKAKIVNEVKLESRINTLESKLSNIESLLIQLVSNKG
jgi:hypothetical protein